MKENMEEKNSKEINLLDLILIFFNWLKKLGLNILNVFGNTLRLLYRHKLINCFIFVVCIAVGFFYLGRSSNREYKAEAMAILNGSISQSVKDVSRQLENFSILSDFTTLSARLSLPDSITKNVTEIKSFYVIDYLNDSTPDLIDFKNKHSLDDTLNIKMPNRLYFRIKTKNVNQVPVFEEAFLNYFNTNERLVREFEVKRNFLSQEIRLINSEINRIDSLAGLSYFKDNNSQIQFTSNQLLVGEQRKQLFYRDFKFLHNEKIKKELEFANYIAPVVLPTGFIVDIRHETGRVKYTAICCLIGLAFSILLSLFLENRKCIFNYLSKKP